MHHMRTKNVSLKFIHWFMEKWLNCRFPPVIAFKQSQKGLKLLLKSYTRVFSTRISPAHSPLGKSLNSFITQDFEHKRQFWQCVNIFTFLPAGSPLQKSWNVFSFKNFEHKRQFWHCTFIVIFFIWSGLLRERERGVQTDWTSKIILSNFWEVYMCRFNVNVRDIIPLRQ